MGKWRAVCVHFLAVPAVEHEERFVELRFTASAEVRVLTS
jgi:hypothetical protein